MQTKKIDTIDIDSIQGLRTKFNELSMNIGLVSVDENNATQQLKEIAKVKEELFSSLDDLKKEEQKLFDQLKEKYGDGQINIDEGTFTPTA
tara:strand:+ start:3526 stop:3798 length:273 start_codon:yes stop_codon:yes gene_type:complete